MSYSQVKNNSPLNEFIAGARGIVPLVIGAIPFGIIFGTLAQTSGLSFGGAMAMSAFVFAGSAQCSLAEVTQGLEICQNKLK